MGERKVINKYIPADFDPSLIPRGKKLSSKDGTVPVRMMLPFSMQCETCATFLYRGRKFNSKKEPVQGPSGRYLGIQRFRFYIKCSHCSRPISFLTDPKNADYEMESGATRNFELHRNTKKEKSTDDDGDQENNNNNHVGNNNDDDDVNKEQQTFGAKEDPMKALENRVLDSQREMADLDNLEEIKAMNARHGRIDPLEALQLEPINQDDDNNNNDDGDGGKVIQQLTEQDEALIRSIRFGKNNNNSNIPNHGGGIIQRLTVEDEERFDQLRREKMLQSARQAEQEASAAAAAQVQKRSNVISSTLFPGLFIRKKRAKKRNQPDNHNDLEQQQQQQKEPKLSTSTTTTSGGGENNEVGEEKENGLASLLGGYDSDSS